MGQAPFISGVVLAGLRFDPGFAALPPDVGLTELVDTAFRALGLVPCWLGLVASDDSICGGVTAGRSD